MFFAKKPKKHPMALIQPHQPRAKPLTQNCHQPPHQTPNTHFRHTQNPVNPIAKRKKKKKNTERKRDSDVIYEDLEAIVYI